MIVVLLTKQIRGVAWMAVFSARKISDWVGGGSSPKPPRSSLSCWGRRGVSVGVRGCTLH